MNFIYNVFPVFIIMKVLIHVRVKKIVKKEIDSLVNDKRGEKEKRKDFIKKYKQKIKEIEERVVLKYKNIIENEINEFFL